MKGNFLSKTRYAIAGTCMLGAVVCLWLASGFTLPATGVARADEEQAAISELSEADRSAVRQMLMQTTVDTLADGLAGVLPDVSGEMEKLGVISSSLDAVAATSAGPIYLAAWDGTRLLHSPMLPDMSGVDFASFDEETARAFVRAVLSSKENDGEFSVVSLPRNACYLPQKQNSGNKAYGEAVLESGQYSTPIFADCTTFSTRPVSPAKEEMHVAYARKIPGTDWLISAFIPTSGQWYQGGFSGAWENSLLSAPNPATEAANERRKGLCVSGLSLLGFAGMLLSPRRRSLDCEEH